jgi:hypothetical protein
MVWMTEIQILAGAMIEIFLFATTSKPALGHTQPPIQWIPGTLTLGIKQSVCEADYSPPFTAKIKNEWICTSTPQYNIFMLWCVIKHRMRLCGMMLSYAEEKLYL